MHDEKEIPEDLMLLLEMLDRLDGIKEEERSVLMQEKPGRKTFFRGEDLVENMRRNEMLVKDEGLFSVRGTPINIIPGGVPGKCREKLLVCIGDRDDLDYRLFQAMEHCFHCKGTTKSVVINTMKWDNMVWEKYRNSFESNGITVVKKEYKERPVRLC